MMSRSRLLHALVLTAFALASPAVLAAELEAESIDATIERAMSEFEVPGMAVSVVRGGKVVYSRGHGVLEAGSDAPVNEDTLFQIASVSKAFTAATLAILVDDGKLDWEDPVIDYLPEFRMHDPWVTREFTIRDLLAHRSGLPLGAGDLLMIPEAQTTRDEIIRAFRHFEPSTSFRSEFAYDNLLYIVAGEVVAAAAGVSFEEFLEQRLLDPLGMSDCRASLNRTADNPNRATPHLLMDGELETTLSLESPLMAAAGGINCSAASMAKWAQFVLNKGAVSDENPIISAAQFRELLKPVTLLPGSGYVTVNTGAFLSAYALGWNVSTFYGEPLLSHSGGLWGMTTFIVLLPAQDLGIFVSNNLMSPAPRAVAFDIADRALRGTSPHAGKDWVQIVLDALAQRRQGAMDVVAEAEESRAKNSRPSLPLDAYAGRYRDPWYGDVEISLRADGSLYFQSIRSEPLGGPLEHFQFDTFIARWKDRGLNADAYVSFSLSPEGKIERIRMKAVSPATDFSFDFHDLDLTPVAGD